MSSPKPLDLALAAIVAELEKGTAPWRKPWKSRAPGLQKRSTGDAFTGINAILLSTISLGRDYGSPYWFTFNQALDMGANVRKGEKGSPAILYKTRLVEGDKDEGSDDRVLRFLKSYSVFNAEQIDGLPPSYHPVTDFSEPPQPLQEDIATIMATFPVTLRHGGDMACYYPLTDRIQMPPRADFDTDEDYVATLLHEYAHATGHVSRLDRFGAETTRDDYAREELVAELASHLVNLHLNLPPSQSVFANHVAYLGAWAKRLKDRPGELLKAACKAQAACDLILSYRRAGTGLQAA